MNTSRTDNKFKKDLKGNKKKGDDVSKLSPTHSEVEEPITLKVIDGEDIQALAIKEDDLKKLAKPKLIAEEKIENLLVKKKNKNAYPTIEVKVAKIVPDKPLKAIEVSDNLGILFDKSGSCIPHSILGTVEEYLQESVAHGKDISVPYEKADIDKPQADLYIKEKKSFTIKLSGDNGENALKNWKFRMNERKSIQNNLSKSLNRPINDLVMNQAESARANMEMKTLLDRTLPLVELGKGYRLGSEFWNQPHLIGSMENGIYTTLTESEKGNLPPIEQISKPYVSRLSGFKENQPPVVNYPWDQSKYLKKRLKKLEPLISELVPHRPDFDLLQIVGQNIDNGRSENNKTEPNDQFKNETWSNPVVFDTTKEGNHEKSHYLLIDSEDPLSAHPDVIQPPIFGPCIIFGGQTAKWTGGEGENTGIVALESRLNFETKASKRVLATFEIFNIGTTVIYYDWKKINEYNPFEIASSDVQRFYFDNRSNIIMPGDLLKLHIVFKSTKGGIFTEKWEFITQPKLLSGASLVLTLRGVAIQEDKYKKIRASIEKRLFSKEAEIVAAKMVELILSGVKTPERAQSPENAYITEEQIFSELNPQFFYDHESVLNVKKLYNELDPDNEWNLSINDFKESIMSLDELDARKQDLLQKLNENIAYMSFRNYSPESSKLYSVGYNVVCRVIDEIANELYIVKENLNLSVLGGDEYPSVDEFNIRYETWKKEFEIFKQIENEKKNRMEKEKSQQKDKDKSGKKGAEKKDDKKKEADKKGSSNKTPIPSAKQTRTSREQVSSRSVSKMEDKIDERVKTPVTSLILTDEQVENKKIFQEKAYINIYQMLSDMVDEIETVFSDLSQETNVNEKLSNLIFKPLGQYELLERLTKTLIRSK